ncbi:MAG: HD-GYP domain-containing protein [Desulfotomaculales bacterium]
MTPVEGDRQHPAVAVLRAPERFYQEIILSLINALEYHKSHTSRHALHVTAFSVHLARNLRGTLISLADVFWGALLHDVGKIAVPQRILQKIEPLTPEEWQIIRTHPVVGHHILEGIGLSREALHVVLFHHERWDGKGYPLGIAGKAIPLEARICALADAFEAMTSDRPYRKALTYEQARDRIRLGSGTQFDPDLVEVFLSIDPGAWAFLRRQASSTRFFTGAEGGGNSEQPDGTWTGAAHQKAESRKG